MSARQIWITRAQPAADATAQRVREMGHEPLVAPLIELVPIEARVDLTGIAALAFTSANGVRAFAEAEARRDLTVYAVGGTTAAAAKAAGFRGVLTADGDVAALAERIVSRKRELMGAVLHPGAAEPAGDLCGALIEAGIEARPLVLYEAIDVAPDEALLAALPGLDAVLLHSPRAAGILAAFLKKHPAPTLRALCLSGAVARPLAKARLRQVASAPFPIEAALLNLIDR
ncbi:uroporphyrinogen-III synthase [Caulobacter ginsengisoli]|uniref:Uroporphyrinogen-III synthase n=1 Tax=Caulobacter ginsengisoli TaxID=400775 RepID=A0ABU0IU11_9CAUL|nr:uroporphyrinogen-III synthase [Caulobacter ginsengisoli]MDQ0465490.1 uroporphyrinogen-III synthase [Caulobacter ginsengisoli]